MQNLSKTEREDLKARHKKERDKRICDRIKAVLLFDEGWSYQQIAHALLLSDEAVRQYVLDFQEHRKLKPENGGSIHKQIEELDFRACARAHALARMRSNQSFL
jgi:DNA-binding NarL/FixJ family response regulator